MEILHQENRFQEVLLPKHFSDQIVKQYNKIYDIAEQQLESLQTYCEMIESENTFEMYQGLVGLGIMLSDETENVALESKLQIVCELNTLKNIIHIIEYNKNQLLLYEALKIIVNLSRDSNEIVAQIRENGSINCIIQKFAKGDYHDLIIEWVCCIFSIVITDRFENNRNYMFKLGSLKILNNYARERVKDFKNLKLIELISWIISKHIFYDPMTLLKDIQVSLQIFQKWIQQDFSLGTLSCICWSFNWFLESYPAQIQMIIDLGIIERIFELLETGNLEISIANIYLLKKILGSHQNHQEYLYGKGIFQCLGRLIKKYIQSHQFVQIILSAFKIISHSEYLSSFLLSSDELDQILQLIYSNDLLIQYEVHNIILNLIKEHQDIKSMNLIQNKKLIHLCKIFISKYLRELEIFEIILDLCEAYLKDERFNQFNEELLELKLKIYIKLLNIK